LRSFVAIELPEALRRSLAELIDNLSAEIEPHTLRWVRPEGIHLTLKFLGDVDPPKMEKVHHVIQEVVPQFSVFTFSAGGLGCFPNLKRPRVLWVGIRDRSGELAALHAGLEQGLSAQGFQREKRAFHPHLTLGRMRRGVRQADQRAVGEALGQTEDFSLGEFRVKEVCLFRSDLRPTGAVYTKLLAASLEEEA
jgi:2'-5' RNA ligase